MTIEFQGTLAPNNSWETSINKTFHAEEVNIFIEGGHHGILSFRGFYEINGVQYSATGISVGHDTFIYEREGKLVIPTYFNPRFLVGYEKSSEEKVFVDVIIDPNKVTHLHLTLVNG